MTRVLLASLAFCASVHGQEAPGTPTPAPDGPLLTIGTALRLALSRNPELLNTSDLLLSARWNERAVHSLFLPQFTPFFAFEKNDETGERIDTYGLQVSQQFLFGTSLEGHVIPGTGGISLDQPHGNPLPEEQSGRGDAGAPS